MTIDWRGFELHPETPIGGCRVDDLFPAEQVEMMFAQLQRLAKQQNAGEIAPGERLSNTRRALAIAEWARESDAVDAFRDAAMVAYWRHGRDLENPDHLRTILAQAGLDPDKGLAASDDPTYLDRIDEIRAEAKRMGVSSIPTFLFGDHQVIVGAQPHAALALAAEAAGARRLGQS